MVCLKTTFHVLESAASRLLFVFFCFIAVWRVTEANCDNTYWLLLFALFPLLFELIYATADRQGNEFKWITPCVFLYLSAGVPCIWLLQLTHLEDRLNATAHHCTSNNGSFNQQLSNVINVVSFSNETWTRVLEQVLIFVLVLAKWIAPTGEMSLDELSQLLLVYMAAGADIIDMVGMIESKEDLSQSKELVYIVLSVWSWSLLQFCIVLTATKKLPNLNNDYEQVTVGGMTLAVLKSPKFDDLNDKADAGVTDSAGGTAVADDGVEVLDVVESHGTHQGPGIGKATPCEYFCFYNEIWGMLISILFQDGPFFAMRLVITIRYSLITQSNVFFMCKNFAVIMLLFNRIRVIIKTEHRTWGHYMHEVDKMRHMENNKAKMISMREQRASLRRIAMRMDRYFFNPVGLGTPRPPKPRWKIWRA